MIKQFYANEPRQTIQRIQQIETLLISEMFLTGLTSSPLKYSASYSRVSEVGFALKMSSDQSIWDEHRPWPYEYFPEILENELSSVLRKKLNVEDIYVIKDRLRTAYEGKSAISIAMKSLQKIIQQRVLELVSAEQIEKYLDKEAYPNLHSKYVVSEWLPNVIFGHFATFLQWAHFLPFEEGEKLQAYMAVYGVGGVPVGWINDTQYIQEITDPNNEGYDEFWEDETLLGNPENCLQVLHFGCSAAQSPDGANTQSVT